MYAPRGEGVNTNAYKYVQGGRGGLNMTKNTHFVRRFIENATNIMLSLMGSKFFSCTGDLYVIYMSTKSNLKGLSIDLLDTNVSKRRAVEN